MSRAKCISYGYAVKHPKTGKFVDDDRGLSTLDEAEQFSSEQDAENFRDMVAHRTAFEDLTVIKVRETIEEV